MKSALALIVSGLVASVLVASSVSACAESASDLDPGPGADGDEKEEDNRASLPPPTGGSKTDAGSSSSSSSSSGSGGIPACDPSVVVDKISEIQAGKPCDATCNPATHCCFDLLGGGGLPIPIPGLSAACITK